MTQGNYISNDRRIAWSILLAALALFIANLDFATCGDAVYYANIIDTLHFDKLTAHQGYYLVGLAFKLVFGTALGLPTDQVLALMNAVFGAGALVVAYLLLKRYLDSESDALLAVIMLVLCPRFFDNSTSAEVYIVQTFFIWASYLLFEQQRYYTAGLSFGLALWVTPLSITFGLLFPVIAWLRGLGFRPLLRMSIPVSLIYIPFLLIFYQELFWGVRGLIEQDENRDIRLLLGLQDVIKSQIKHYSVLNLLFIPALLMLRREKPLLIITLAAVVPNIYTFTQLLGEDSVFIMALDIFIVGWFVIGWRYLREHSLAPAAAVLLVLQLLVFIYVERPFVDDMRRDYAGEYRAIGRAMLEAENPVLFIEWNQRMAYIYYNRDEHAWPLEKGPWYDHTVDIAEYTESRRRGAATGYRGEGLPHTIFVLDSYSVSPQSRLYLSDEFLQQRYRLMAQRPRVEHMLDVSCEPILQGHSTLYKCK